MSKFYYTDEKGKNIFIKKVDYANEELEFTDNPYEAYTERNGYYMNPTKDYIKFHFKEKYPQVKTLKAVETF